MEFNYFRLFACPPFRKKQQCFATFLAAFMSESIDMKIFRNERKKFRPETEKFSLFPRSWNFEWSDKKPAEHEQAWTHKNQTLHLCCDVVSANWNWSEDCEGEDWIMHNESSHTSKARGHVSWLKDFCDYIRPNFHDNFSFDEVCLEIYKSPPETQSFWSSEKLEFISFVAWKTNSLLISIWYFSRVRQSFRISFKKAMDG